MINREDILSMEYLKKAEYTGSHRGMRYRLERVEKEEGDKRLKVTVWPEPFNFFTTPAQEKESAEFTFAEDGVVDAVAWMNDRFRAGREKWEHATDNWDILPETWR